MLIKIYEYPKAKKTKITIVECDHFEYEALFVEDLKVGNRAVFDLYDKQHNRINCIFAEVPALVYIMNNDGKTFEKFTLMEVDLPKNKK